MTVSGGTSGRIVATALAVGAVVALGAGTAHADFTESHSGSCSGTVRGWGNFYAYTYQYVHVDDNRIENEQHTFSFSGFLDGAEDARLLRGSDNKWVVYRAGDFDISVPYVAGAGLFVRDNQRSGNDWVKLCSY